MVYTKKVSDILFHLNRSPTVYIHIEVHLILNSTKFLFAKIKYKAYDLSCMLLLCIIVVIEYINDLFLLFQYTNQIKYNLSIFITHKHNTIIIKKIYKKA